MLTRILPDVVLPSALLHSNLDDESGFTFQKYLNLCLVSYRWMKHLRSGLITDPSRCDAGAGSRQG